MAKAWQFPGELICQDCGQRMDWKFFHDRDARSKPDLTKPNWHVFCRTRECPQFGKRLTMLLPTVDLTEL